MPMPAPDRRRCGRRHPTATTVPNTFSNASTCRLQPRPPMRPRQDAQRRLGASWLGKIAGKSGRLPVRSYFARKRSRIADWPLVRLYKLHMLFDYAAIRAVGKEVVHAEVAASSARDC